MLPAAAAAAASAAAATAASAATTTATTATAAVTTTAAAATVTAVAAAAATTVAAAAAATTVATATAAAAATFTLFGFIDVECPAVQDRTVHLFRRLLSVSLLLEGHESEATATTRLTVINDLCILDGAELFERRAKSLIVGAPAEAANKKLFSHFSCLVQPVSESLSASVRDWRAHERILLMAPPQRAVNNNPQGSLLVARFNFEGR